MTGPAGLKAFSPVEVAAILIVGVIGVLIPGLQPQLLGALAAEGKVSVAALGPLATVELLAMGAAAGAAGFVLPITRLRMIAGGALAVTALVDLLTPMLGGGSVFVARILAGLAEGVLIWIAIGFIVRTAHPERWSGLYLAIQTLSQFAVATAIGVIAAGSGPSFQLLAGVTIAGFAVIAFMPRAYSPIAPPAETDSVLPPRGIIALLGVLIYLAFVVSIWVYIEPLAASRGVPAGMVRLIAPLSLAMQVVGAGAATFLAGRIPPRAALIAVALANLGLLAVMAVPPSSTMFVAATAAFGFLWLFVMPFQIPLVIAADPTRRATTLIGGAQLTGSGLGPLVAGFLLGDGRISPVLWLGAVMLSGGTMILLASAMTRASRDAIAST